MGAYLSSPICDKETIEDSNDRLVFAASSMQGWRISQEDAHNAILNYDNKTSFFAIYDGHGGAEVAIYCSRYFPEFLKELDSYREGRLNDALKEGFLKFDALLIDPNVKKILQKLSNDENSPVNDEIIISSNSNEDQFDREETELLQEEAQMPMEELLKRYNENEKYFHSPQLSQRMKQQQMEDHENLQITTKIESNSLTRHLVEENTNQSEDEEEEDSEFDGSDEETSEEEDGENLSDSDKAKEIQKLMTDSIIEILNKSVEKKENSDEDQNEENPREEEESDVEMLDMVNDPGSSSGCTAVVAILRDKQLFVANAGDSRCVVCRAGRAIDITSDHKPEDPQERQRIEKAGYKVTSDGRVSGGLNLSRAIGDHGYKKTKTLVAEEQAITALPDIRCLTLDEQDQFLVLACDGIWNFMSSQEVVDFVRIRLEKKKMSQICEELFMNCLAPNTCGDGTGCDNMTAIIVRFDSSTLSSSEEKALSAVQIISPMSKNNKRRFLPSPQRSPEIENDDLTNRKKLKIFPEEKIVSL